MAGPYTLRMKQLPKPEYVVMKGMVKEYNLEDPSELFAVLLRLAQVVVATHQGRQDWLQIIDQYRNEPKPVDKLASDTVNL